MTEIVLLIIAGAVPALAVMVIAALLLGRVAHVVLTAAPAGQRLYAAVSATLRLFSLVLAWLLSHAASQPWRWL